MPRGIPAVRRLTPLRELMLARGLRPVDVAAISGVSLYHVYQLLGVRGEPMASMKLTVLLRIAYALGVAPIDVFPGLEWRPPKPVRLAHNAVAAALRGDALHVVTRDGVDVVEGGENVRAFADRPEARDVIPHYGRDR